VGGTYAKKEKKPKNLLEFWAKGVCAEDRTIYPRKVGRRKGGDSLRASVTADARGGQGQRERGYVIGIAAEGDTGGDRTRRGGGSPRLPLAAFVA